GDPVRQDRSLQFSADGRHAAFVDEREGIFVTDTVGGKPVRIARLPPGALAASVPLWAPDDDRLIYALARKADDAPPAAVGRDDPEGATHSAENVVYTVSLRAAPRGAGDNPEPQELFTATSGHPGYVAANHALRWRPDGRALLFVRQTGKDSHAVF